MPKFRPSKQTLSTWPSKNGSIFPILRTKAESFSKLSALQFNGKAFRRYNISSFPVFAPALPRVPYNGRNSFNELFRFNRLLCSGNALHLTHFQKCIEDLIECRTRAAQPF